MDGEAKEGYLLNVVYGSSCQLGFPLSNLFLTAISIPLTAGLLPQVMFSLSKILLAICFVTQITLKHPLAQWEFSHD